jgi:hypothetical protein
MFEVYVNNKISDRYDEKLIHQIALNVDPSNIKFNRNVLRNVEEET